MLRARQGSLFTTISSSVLANLWQRVTASARTSDGLRRSARAAMLIRG
jgi:hypothetical protein